MAHTVTNEAPCRLLLHMKLRTKLDFLRTLTEQIVELKQAEQKQQHDENVREWAFIPTDLAMARNLAAGRKWLPCCGPLSYI